MISVCIATYNRKEYLKETLESAFRQTCKNYEVIVLDDGSTDGTEQMVASLGYPIRYYKQTHHGQPQSYNRSVELAQGKYICFLDSDDLFLDDSLERLAAAANGSENKIAYGSYIRIDENGNQTGRDKKRLYSGFITDELFQKIFVHCVASLIPRKLFLELGGYDTSLKVCFDYDFNLRLSLSHEFVALDQPVFKRRRHASNMSGYNYRNHMAELKVLEDFYFSKGGKDKIPMRLAYGRLAKQAYRAGKCAIQEKRYPEGWKILKRSLEYHYSFKSLWMLLKLKLFRRFSP